ncbi:hypothetical protein ACHHYP_14870 [Achlya hypogyna]|uniref:DNA replication checkpoint mediator MRC1 domain-containing protein n=1 Tax=Achlya hypogyna TaxID=1202772 RepID=A0A1V9YC44_ACHHY|nr:hypothetical protein ACHHYP_14870 [Achlya hypogyna]
MAAPTPTTMDATAGAPSPDVEAMAIAAETQDLLLSLRRTDAKKQDEVRSKKDALLQKLRAKSARPAPARPGLFSPTKTTHAMPIPVARATSHPLLHGKKRMLGEIKKTALAQGAESMAKLFGYKNYHEQQQHLKKEEEARIQFNALKKQQEAAKPPPRHDDDDDDDEDYVEGQDDNDDEENDEEVQLAKDLAPDHAIDVADNDSNDLGDANHADDENHRRDEANTVAAEAAITPSDADLRSATAPIDQQVEESTAGDDADDEDEAPRAKSAGRQRLTRRITALSDDEDNAVDSDGETAAAMAAVRAKDKAANFRALLAAEDSNTKQRRRLNNKLTLVESEAEEDEEEDVLKIGGLGDFGFGVPLAATAADKEREEEASAMQLREDDLEHIVDELSDDEKDKDADEAFRDDMEARDRAQVTEVMRNVREGFGRNRRLFSTGINNGEARGRFNLNDLVAADGSKTEAARLGLLESDEEADGEVADEDEEERMERELRERFLHQPQIYITSSESESDAEEPAAADADADVAVVSDDEEREERQMKLFSAKAKINRRMQRMAQVQKAQAKERDAPVLPALLDDDMEESQELVKGLRAPAAPSAPVAKKRTKYALTATTSSFARVADTCKMFPTSTTTKAFVFASSAFAETTAEAPADAPEKENAAQQPNARKRPLDGVVLGAKSAKSAKAAKGAKPKSALLSALSSYQCQ